MRIGSRLSSVVATLGLLSGTLIISAPSAAAGECSSVGCGEIVNSSLSPRSLKVTGNWGTKSPSTYVSPGSGAYFVDDDGYEVPTGYSAKICPIGGCRAHGGYTVGPGWHKITDEAHIQVILIKR
jgi:hypothetical protein